MRDQRLNEFEIELSMFIALIRIVADVQAVVPFIGMHIHTLPLPILSSFI